MYNGHKRKHAIKFQAVIAPDRLILHVYGSVEGRRHDWSLYTRSNLEYELPEFMSPEHQNFCIYGDSRYAKRWVMEVTYQGSILSASQKSVQ